MPMSKHNPILVLTLNWIRQNAKTGMAARNMSVKAEKARWKLVRDRDHIEKVFLLISRSLLPPTKYEYPVITVDDRHFAGINGFQRNSVGEHWANKIMQDIPAMMFWVIGTL